MDSILRAVDAFKQVILLEPERDFDPTRTSPKAAERVPGRPHAGARDPAAARRQCHVRGWAGRGGGALHRDAARACRHAGPWRGPADLAPDRFDRGERSGEHSLARPVGERRSVPAGDYNIVVEATWGRTISRRRSRSASRMARSILCRTSPVCQANVFARNRSAAQRAGSPWGLRSSTPGLPWRERPPFPAAIWGRRRYAKGA